MMVDFEVSQLMPLQAGVKEFPHIRVVSEVQGMGRLLRAFALAT